jgi:hypothetical protein
MITFSLAIFYIALKWDTTLILLNNNREPLADFAEVTIFKWHPFKNSKES